MIRIRFNISRDLLIGFYFSVGHVACFHGKRSIFELYSRRKVGEYMLLGREKQKYGLLVFIYYSDGKVKGPFSDH